MNKFKFSTLKTGVNEIIFLNNILKDDTYGEQIILKDFCYISDNGIMFCDDEKIPLFKPLRQLYQNNYNINTNISFSKRYFTYCLLNGEYTLLRFGNDLKNIIDNLKNFNPKKYVLIVTYVKGVHGFKKIDSYYIYDIDINLLTHINDDFLKTKTIYIEDYFNSNKWNAEKNYSKIIDFFKKYGLENLIKNIKHKQRRSKILNLMKEDLVEVPIDILKNVLEIFEQYDIDENEIENEIKKLIL